MTITLNMDAKKFILASTLKKEDIELVKKYRPSELKIQDKDGNDIFAMSYCEGHPYIGKNGITFGAESHEGKYAIVVGDLPAGDNVEDKVADMVGVALSYINTLEKALPAVVTGIKEERAALIGSIKKA